MEEPYLHDQTFENLEELPKGEYENCTFMRCSLANQDISSFKFLNCDFIGCNLSLTKLKNTVFHDVTFKNCKMLGLRFDDVYPHGLSLSFENCQLNHSSFFELKMKQTKFHQCHLLEVDFSGTDLSLAVFEDCDLSGALFDQTNLEYVDFTTAHHYAIDPDKNRLKKAKFSMMGISGLLHKYDIEIL